MKIKKKYLGIIGVILIALIVGFLPKGGNADLSSDIPQAAVEEAQQSEGFSLPIAYADPQAIPEYDGNDVIKLNGNKPSFTDYDIENLTGENYSDLDELGRCGTAFVMLDRSMQPTGKRDSISHIKPSGWKQKKYPGLVDTDPPYIYNGSHLIAYALAGEDDNENNLITGTRHMNGETMLPYEESVMRYMDEYDNHVLYRVTPYFVGTELVARGVEMEAYSVEDNGEGICYHVFVYNVHPGIEIDYQTGNSYEL